MIHQNRYTYHQVVSTNDFLVGDGVVNKVVSSAEGELVLGGLGGVPLHGVLRSELTEVSQNERIVLRDGESALVAASSPVLLAVRDELVVQGVGATRAGAGSQRGASGASRGSAGGGRGRRRDGRGG